MRGSFKAAGLAAALALVVAAPAVTATMPGRNGRITYAVQDDTGQQQIWIAGADEAHPVQLTFAANTSLATDWSPDASRIAFDSDRTGDVEVYTMKPDGSDVVRLTFDPGSMRRRRTRLTDPPWSGTTRPPMRPRTGCTSCAHPTAVRCGG